MDHVLTISGLIRRFGSVLANDGISLRVRPGEVVGLLGHNGAGKTTLVSQLVGLLRPDAGIIHLGEVDAVNRPAEARRRVALQSQSQAPIDGLTPRSAIEIACRLRGLSTTDARSSAEVLAEELDIGDWIDQRALPEGRGLSGGVRRLTSFAMAAAAPTPLLVLDEPTNDVDASRRRLLWDAVRRRADEGAGVLLVTHNVTEAERIVDELVILDRGRVVASGSPAQLRGTQDTDLRLELQLPRAGADPSAELASDSVAPPFGRRMRRGRNIVLTLAEQDASQAVTWANRLRATEQISGYGLAPTTLEDAYLGLTSSTPDDAETPDQESIHV